MPKPKERCWRGPRLVDDKPVRPFDHPLVTIAGDVPRGDFLALVDGFPTDLEIRDRSTPHIRERGLMPDNSRRHAVDQARIRFRRIVAADDQPDEVPQEPHRPVQRVMRALAMGHHRDQVQARGPSPRDVECL